MSGEESFRAALRESRIEYSGPIYIDGKLHRIRADGDRSKNSWYVLYTGSPVAGAYGCWKRDLKEIWCERNGSLTQPEWQDVRQRWQEATKKLKAETVARQKKARKVAAWILNRSRPALTLHRYLFRKGVKVFGNLRVYRRSLVLPLRDLTGELQSLQFIAGDGAKNFLRGGRIAGCLFALTDKAEGALVICEGYATGASIYEAIGHAVFCAMNSGNLLEVAKAVRERWPQREIIIAADNDLFTDGNPGLTKATAAAKAIRAKLAVPQFKDLSNQPTDFNDLAMHETLGAVRAQISAARVPTETDSDTFARLAALSPADYDRCRETEAAALGIRVTTLDAEIQRLCPRAGGGDSMLQGCAINLPDVEPWETQVNGADVLNEVSERLGHYVAMPSAARDAHALYIAHTHCFEAFDHTPRANVRSADKNCGKTTLLDVMATMVPRPLRAESLTSAVMFRLVASCKPTLLLDEVDSYRLEEVEELRGLLNAGHKRTGTAYRCEGDSHTVRAFPVFAPAVLAGIGALPGTLHDRSIIIKLERAKPGEVAARFDSRRVEYETELCRKLVRWTDDNFDALRDCDPQLPETAFNRLADNWRPLFAIAEARVVIGRSAHTQLLWR